MLNFYDVPSPGPAGGSTVGLSEVTFADARAKVKTLWQSWFSANSVLGSPQGLDINLDEIAACLGAEDDKAGMPFSEAQRYVRVYLDETFLNGDIVSNEFMASLPQYHRAAADAVLAVAVSLSVAKKKGYYWFATRNAVNRVFPKLAELWTKRWSNDKEGGPDYFMVRAFGDAAFYEVKGNAGPSHLPPVRFYSNKTQSVNALFVNHSYRNILSIVNFPADGLWPINVDVQWFNSSQDEFLEPTSLQKMQLLLIAICQFETQLRIYRQDFHSLIIDPEENWELRAEGEIFIEEGNKQQKIAVESKALSIFGQAYSLIHNLHTELAQNRELPDLDNPNFVGILNQLVGDLNALVDSSSTLDSILEQSEITTLYRYSNGIRIVSTSDDRADVVQRDYG